MDTSLLSSRSKSRRLISAIFGLGLLIRLVLPWFARGFRYMDEHWQVVEPANYLLHRVWSITPEWREGLRSWIYPWLISRVMFVTENLGVTEPTSIISITRMVHGALLSLAILIVYSFVKRTLLERLFPKKKAELFALAAAAFVAFWPGQLFGATHTHGEMTASLFVLLAFFTLDRSALLAGALLGFAAALKIDNAVAGVGLGVWLLFQNQFRALFKFTLGVLPFAFIVGLVDKLTWGKWFQSVLGHAHVNLVEKIGNQWGVSPWYTHFLYFLDETSVFGLVALVALPFVWKNLSRTVRAAWFSTLFFILVFSCVDHKEERFIAPLLQLSVFLSAVTLAELSRHSRFRWNPRAAKIFLVLVIIHFGVGIRQDLILQPWADRIQAMRNAGKIPGIEAMFTQQWSAPFYLRHSVPGRCIEGTQEAATREGAIYRVIGVADDGNPDFFVRAGFSCTGWPTPRPKGDLVPWAFRCERAK